MAIALLLAALVPAAAQPGPAATDPPPTSYQLIDRALEARRINAETAHTYRVFAAYGDSRLPAEYRGALGGLEPPVEVDRVGSLLSAFSAQTQAELAPFFMRPDEPGSWLTLGTVGDQEPGAGVPRPPDGGRGGARSLSAAGGAAFSHAAFAANARKVATARVPVSLGRPTAPIITWRTFRAAGGKVKVWAQDRYVGDAAKAESLALEFDRRIWGLTRLMRREPVSDRHRTPNGGDGALDVYLVHPPTEIDRQTGVRGPEWEGWSRATHRANECDSSRYVLINSRRPLVGNARTPGILSIAAHELFHAIGSAFRAIEACEVRWVREGSATWAENWIYPAPNTEHAMASAYVRTSQHSIDSGRDMYPDYGTYLLPLYREKTGGTPDFMRTMWENFERLNAATPPLPATITLAQRRAHWRTERLRTLKGVNSVLAGGFDETWPLFLVKMWNQAPVDPPDGHKTWDRMVDTPTVWGARRNIETPTDPVTVPITLPAGLDGTATTSIMPLSGVFTHFTFRGNVRSVVFVNTIAEIAHLHSSVWGIQKIRGRWRDPEDWTKAFQKAWCRDDTKEDIEELVIIFGNSDSERLEPVKPDKLPEIKAYPTGCTAWVGTSTAATTITSADPAVTIVETADATLRFEIDSALILTGEPREYWKVKSGLITWTATATGVCTGSARGTQAITDMGPGDEIATLRVWDDAGTMRYSGASGPWPGDIPTFTLTCPTQAPVKMPLHIALGWFVTDMQNDKLSRDGKSISGGYRNRQADGGSGITTMMGYTLRLSP